MLRAGLLKLGGGMLGRLLAADPGYRGPRVDCGSGHQAAFVAYRGKVIDTVLGPVTLRGPGITAPSAGTASPRATPSWARPGRPCRRAWPR